MGMLCFFLRCVFGGEGEGNGLCFCFWLWDFVCNGGVDFKGV